MKTKLTKLFTLLAMVGLASAAWAYNNAWKTYCFEQASIDRTLIDGTAAYKQYSNSRRGIAACVDIDENATSTAYTIIKYEHATEGNNTITLGITAEGKYNLTVYSGTTQKYSIDSSASVTAGLHRFAMMMRRGNGNTGSSVDHIICIKVYMDGDLLVEAGDGTEKFGTGPFEYVQFGTSGSANTISGAIWKETPTVANATLDADDTTAANNIIADAAKLFVPDFTATIAADTKWSDIQWTGAGEQTADSVYMITATADCRVTFDSAATVASLLLAGGHQVDLVLTASATAISGVNPIGDTTYCKVFPNDGDKVTTTAWSVPTDATYVIEGPSSGSKKWTGTITVASGASLVTRGNLALESSSNTSAEGSTFTVESGLMNYNCAEKGVGGHIIVKAGATLQMSTGRGSDALNFGVSANQYIDVYGTLDMQTTRWTMNSKNILNVYPGAEVKGTGNSTYGALDANQNLTIYAKKNGSTGGTATISSNLRPRNGQDAFTFDVEDGMELIVSGVRKNSSGGFNKSGAGVLKVTAFDFDKQIDVNAGTLKVGTTSAQTNARVNVANGATFETLSGTELTLTTTDFRGTVTVDAGSKLTVKGIATDPIPATHTLNVYGEYVINTRYACKGGATFNFYAGATISGTGDAYGAFDMCDNAATFHAYDYDGSDNKTIVITAPWRLRIGHTIDIAAGVTVDVQGQIGYNTNAASATSTLTKTGAGTLKFSGSDAKHVKGNITISAGMFVCNVQPFTDTSKTLTIANGATLDVSAWTSPSINNLTLNGTLVLGSQRNATFTTLSGSGVVTAVLTSEEITAATTVTLFTSTTKADTVTAAVTDSAGRQYTLTKSSTDYTVDPTAPIDVAQIGENTYKSLAEALVAVTEGQTVTLLVNASESLSTEKAFTLALGDYTLSGSLAIQAPGAVTLTVGSGALSSTLTGTGTIVYKAATATTSVNFDPSTTLSSFTGTMQVSQGRYQIGGKNFPAAVSAKVTNGGQFYLTGSVDLGAGLTASGNGWSGDPSAAGSYQCAVRFENGSTVTGNLTLENETVGETTYDYVNIGVHSGTGTFNGTLLGSTKMKVKGSGTLDMNGATFSGSNPIEVLSGATLALGTNRIENVVSGAGTVQATLTASEVTALEGGTSVQLFKVSGSAPTTVTVTDSSSNTYLMKVIGGYCVALVASPTISLGFDNGKAASTVLGGAAPSSPGDWDASGVTYTKVRESDANYAMTVSSSSPTARPDGTVPSGMSDSTSWSMHGVLKLANVDNGVLFGIGGQAWQKDSYGIGVERKAADKVQVVYWYKQVKDGAYTRTVIIDDVAVAHSTTRYHSYLLTFNASASGTAESPYYTLYIDGTAVGNSGTTAKCTGYCTANTPSWCVGNYYGGASAVAAAIFDGAQVDDFAIWKDKCLTAAEATAVAGMFPLWPTHEELSMMYHNRLADGEVIMPDTYGAITLTGVRAATVFNAMDDLSSTADEPEIGGSYAGTITKSGGDTDTATHTIAGWFKVDDLTTEKLLWFARSMGGDIPAQSPHGGYRIAVSTDGAIKFSKAIWTGGGESTGDNGDSGVQQTATGVIAAGNWYHIALAITKTSGVRAVSQVLYVNGAVVAMSGDKAVKSNMAGNGCGECYIGAGVSAAGIYVDNNAFEEAFCAINVATDTTYVKESDYYVAEIGASESTKDFSALSWTPSTPSFASDTKLMVINKSDSATLTFNQAVTAGLLKINGASGKNLTLALSSTYAANIGTIDFSNASGTTAFDVASDDTVTLASVLTGSAFEKTGAGALTLSGKITPAITVSAGQLNVPSGHVTGNITLGADGTLNVTGTAGQAVYTICGGTFDNTASGTVLLNGNALGDTHQVVGNTIQLVTMPEAKVKDFTNIGLTYGASGAYSLPGITTLGHGGWSTVTIPGVATAARKSERTDRTAMVGPVVSDGGGLEAQLRIIQNTTLNYVQYELVLTNTTDAAINIGTYTIFSGWKPGSTADGAVNGGTQGAVIVFPTDKAYLGVENPQTVISVTDGTGTATLPRDFDIEAHESWSVKWVYGTYSDATQLRREFQAYLDNERAHPYRVFPHYNSWYDLCIQCHDNTDPANRLTDAKILPQIQKFREKLSTARGCNMLSYLIDDGWDNWYSVWDFHSALPNGFTNVYNEAKLDTGASISCWMSPCGGYGTSFQQRLKYAKDQGYVPQSATVLKLSQPGYYAPFRDRVMSMIHDYDMNMFKFDRMGSGDDCTGASSQYAPDIAAVVRLIGEMRAAKPDVFVNATVGTWASPFWTMYADSIWRGGGDYGGQKDNTNNGYTIGDTTRQRWITYRDDVIYNRFASNNKLFPLNSMMNHGIIVTTNGTDGTGGDASALSGKGAWIKTNSAEALQDFCDEMWMSMACGTDCQEYYITPELMYDDWWDALATGIKWLEANEDILRDVHWVGGDPFTGTYGTSATDKQGAIYGYASWKDGKGIVVLRNSHSAQLTLSKSFSDIFELPSTAAKGVKSIKRVFSHNADLTTYFTMPADADTAVTFTLPAYDVVLMEVEFDNAAWPITTTASGTSVTTTGATWTDNDGNPYMGGFDRLIPSMTMTAGNDAACVWTNDVALNVGTLTFAGTGDADFTVVNSNDCSITAAYIDALNTSNTLTLDFVTGAAAVTAGVNTVLTQDGTTGGAIYVLDGKKATVPAWYFGHRSLLPGGYLKLTGDVGTQTLATSGGIPSRGATVEIAGTATIAADSEFASNLADTKIIVSGTVSTASGNAEIKLANNANSIFEVADGELVLQNRVRIQKDATGKLILSGGEIKATSTGFLYPGGGYAGGSMDFTITGGTFTAPYNPYNQKMGCDAKVNISGGIFAPENLYTTGDGNKPSTDDTATSRSGSGFAVNMTGGTFEMPSGVPNWLPVNVTSGTAKLSVQDGVTTAYNYGLLTVSAGATAQIDPGEGKAIRAKGGFTNNGTIEIVSGALMVDKASTALGTVALNGGVLDLNGWGVSGVTFTGSGVVTNSSTNAGSVNGVKVAQDETLTVTDGKITITVAEGEELTLTGIPGANQVVIDGAGRVVYSNATVPTLPSGLWASNWTGTFVATNVTSAANAWELGTYYNGTTSKFEFNGTMPSGYIKVGTLTLGELILNGSITLSTGSETLTATFTKLSGSGTFNYTGTANPKFAFADIDDFTGTLNAGTKGNFIVGSTNTDYSGDGVILCKGTVALAADSLAGTWVRIADSSTLKVNKPDFTASKLYVNGGTLDLSAMVATNAWITPGATTFAGSSKIIVPEYAAVFPGTYTVVSGSGNVTGTSNVTFKNGTTALSGHTVAGEGTQTVTLTTAGTQMYFNRLGGSAVLTNGTYGAIELDIKALATKYDEETSLDNSASAPERGGAYADIIKDGTYINTHTVAGWFNVGDLPTDSGLKVIYVAQTGKTSGEATTGEHCGYKVAVDKDGKLYVGKVKSSGPWAWQGDATYKATTASAVSGNSWFHLAIAATADSSAKTVTPVIYVNGQSVAVDSGTFAGNLNGNKCVKFYIGAGVTAAGIYVDKGAIAGAEIVKLLATSPTYLKPYKYTAMIDSDTAVDYTALDWQPTPSDGDFTANCEWEITNTAANATLNFNTAVVAGGISFFGADGKNLTLTKGDDTPTSSVWISTSFNGKLTYDFDLGTTTVKLGKSTQFNGTTGTIAPVPDNATIRYAADGYEAAITDLKSNVTNAFANGTVSGDFHTNYRTFRVDEGDNLTLTTTDTANRRINADITVTGGNLTLAGSDTQLWFGKFGTSKYNQTGGNVIATPVSSVTSGDNNTFLLAYNNETANPMNILGGLFAVSNSMAEIYSDITVNVGDGATALFKGLRGRSNRGTINVAGTLKIGSMGVTSTLKALNLNGGKLLAYESATVSQTITAGTGAKIGAANGQILAIEGNANTLSGVTVENEGTGMVVFYCDHDTTRSDIPSGAYLGYRETDVNDLGVITVPTPADGVSVKLFRADGVTEITGATSEVVGDKTVYTFKPAFDGKLCYWDYEFIRDAVPGRWGGENTGTEGVAASWDGDKRDHQGSSEEDSRKEPKATNFVPVEGQTYRQGLYLSARPYRHLATDYPTEVTFAFYGTMPASNNTAIVCFGSESADHKSSANTQQLLYFRTGDAATRQIQLVYYDNVTKADPVELCTMTVPHNATAKHLYAITLKRNTYGNTLVEVYLDGELWQPYTFDHAITLGRGFQVGGCHGHDAGAGKSANTFDRPTDADPAAIDWLRVYEGSLSEATMLAMAEVYPFENPLGEYYRDVSNETNPVWDAEGKWIWSKGGTTNLPPKGCGITITNTTDKTLYVNTTNDQGITSLKIVGGGTLTIDREADCTNKVHISGNTVADADIITKNFALDLNGGHVRVKTGRTVTFDMSGHVLSNYVQNAEMCLAGYSVFEGTGTFAFTKPTGDAAAVGRMALMSYMPATGHYHMFVIVRLETALGADDVPASTTWSDLTGDNAGDYWHPNKTEAPDLWDDDKGLPDWSNIALRFTATNGTAAVNFNDANAACYVLEVEGTNDVSLTGTLAVNSSKGWIDFSEAKGKVTVGFDTGATKIYLGNRTELVGGSGTLSVATNQTAYVKINNGTGAWSGMMEVGEGGQIIFETTGQQQVKALDVEPGSTLTIVTNTTDAAIKVTDAESVDLMGVTVNLAPGADTNLTYAAEGGVYKLVDAKSIVNHDLADFSNITNRGVWTISVETVDSRQVLKATKSRAIYVKPGDNSVVADQGNKVDSLDLPFETIKANTDLTDDATQADVLEALNTDGANGYKVWESVVLGLTATNAASKLCVVPMQTTNTSKLTLVAPTYTVAPGSGASVTNCFYESTDLNTWSEVSGGGVAPGGEKELSLPSTGVKYYKLKTTITTPTK